MREEILRRHRSLLRRAARVRGFDAFLEAAFILTSIAALLVLADRLAFELGVVTATLSRPDVIWGLLAGCFVLSAGYATAAVLYRKPASAAIAWAADRSMSTDALFLSAVEIAQSPAGNGFESLVLEEAARESRNIQPGKVVPTPPVRHRWAIALAFAAGAALLMLPPQVDSPPVAEYEITPIRGNAPLHIVAQEACIGKVDRYEWDFGDGTILRGRRFNHVYAEPGRYPVKLTVFGPGGAAEISREVVEVVAREYVVADFVATPDKGRAPLTVAFRNLSSNADTNAWTFGDGAISGQRNPIHVFEKPGIYTVVLDVEGGGSKDQAKKRIKVVGPDAPLADFTANPTKGPEPLAVQFENRSTGKITDYEWDFGDPLAETSIETDPSHVYKMPGTYTVTLRARGPGGEDIEVKKNYIRVGDDGSGGGGGSQDSSGGGGGKDKTGGFDKKAAPHMLDKKDPRPEVDPITQVVELPGKGDLVKKDKRVYTGGDKGSGGRDEPYRPEVFDRYRKAAEDALSRETIPAPARDFVRKYFESIRPK